MDELSSLSVENMYNISHGLPLDKIFDIWSSNDENFWKLKYIQHFGPADQYTGSWKELYLKYRNVWTFGKNDFGQLGLYDDYDRNSPTQIPDIKAKQVSAGFLHTCLIDIVNNVWFFTHHKDMNPGYTPILFTDLKAKQISAHYSRSIIVINLEDEVRSRKSFIYFNPKLKVKQMSWSTTHGAMVDFDNNVWTVGLNEHGELGLGDDLDYGYAPIQIPNLTAKQVSAGGYHTLIIDIEDNVWSFGYNIYGQLGLEDDINRNTPIQISNLQATQISAGGNHTVIIDLKYNVWTFGSNYYGQLGIGDNIDRNTPTQIPYVKAKQVSAGQYHTILVDLEDNVWSFGSNSNGQLGLGDNIDRNIPTQIPGFKAFTVSAGYYNTIMIATLVNPPQSYWNWLSFIST